MNVHNAGPDFALTYDYGSRAEIDQYEIDELTEKGVVDLWYAYKTDGGYEGNGVAIVKTPDGWDAFDLSHCSCNAPFYDWKRGNEKPTLAEIIGSGTDEWAKDVIALASHFGLAQ